MGHGSLNEHRINTNTIFAFLTYFLRPILQMIIGKHTNKVRQNENHVEYISKLV